MRRGVGWFACVGLLLGGVALLALYGVGVATASDRVEAGSEYGSVAAFGLVGVLAGGALAVLLGRANARRPLRFPPIWLGAIIFACAVGLGFVVHLYEWVVFAAPALVVAALLGLGIVIGRFVTRWLPGRRADARVVLISLLWGMTGAVALTLMLQMAAGLSLLAGVVGGVALADPELLEGAGLRDLLDEIADDPSGGGLESLINTPTVAFGLMAMIAVIAPLTEELTKAFGATLVVRGHAFTLYNAFLGGAMGGLGFALVENVGYVMADPVTWPQLMLLRAPVSIIHVAAAALVAVGWYLQRTRGGLALLWFYLAAVIVHGGWNALFGALLLVSSGALDGEDPSVAASLLSLVLVGAMGAVLLGSFSWVLMNARRLAAAVPPGRVGVGAEHGALALAGTP